MEAKGGWPGKCLGRDCLCVCLTMDLVSFVFKQTIQWYCTVIRFVWVSAKFGTCTVVSVNGTLIEAKICTFTLESTHFLFNKCPIYTHDGASAKLSDNSHETDYSVYCTVPLPQKHTNPSKSEIQRRSVEAFFSVIFASDILPYFGSK
jgi:hypothetical protein